MEEPSLPLLSPLASPCHIPPPSQLDNHGRRLLLSEEASLNIPAVAAAHVVKRYTAQAPDELSFEVRLWRNRFQSWMPHFPATSDPPSSHLPTSRWETLSQLSTCRPQRIGAGGGAREASR